MNKHLQYPILLFLLLPFTLHAQLPSIDTLYVCSPPSSNAPTYIIGDFLFSSGGCLLVSQNYFMQGNTIHISALYCLGIATFICGRTDTFNLGILPPGNYDVNFSIIVVGADLVNNTQCSLPVGSDFSSDLSFSILDGINIGSNIQVCEGEPVNIFAGDGCYYNFQWQDGSTESVYTATAPGTYSVTAFNQNGDSLYTYSSTVFNFPSPIVDLGPDTTICQGDVIWLDATNTGASYLWSNTSLAPSIAVMDAGIYRVTVTGSNGCITEDTVEISTQPFPIIEIPDSVTFCAGDSALIDAGQGFSSYLWSNGDTTQQLVIKNGGNYSVTVSDSFNCSAISNMIFATVENCTNSLDEFKNLVEMAIYPNPANDLIEVSLSGIQYESFALALYDLSGRIIIEANGEGNSLELDVREIPSGVYLIFVQTGKGKSGWEKVIIR